MTNPKFQLVLVSFLCLTLIFSCNQQPNTTAVKHDVDIPPLQDINPAPSGHYATLAAYPATAAEENHPLDSIRFPNQIHAQVLKQITPAYLSQAEMDSLIAELKPPANSSAQVRAELDFLLELQASRTPKQVERAIVMNDIFYFPAYGVNKEEDLLYELHEVLGDDFQPDQYPATKVLLQNIMQEMRIVEFTAKNHFLRARPRQLEAQLQPLKKMKSSSFASGHTLWAYMQAYLLSELIPAKRQAFLDLAYELGYSREILGVHYPSDEEASRKLAHQLLQQMWGKPAFATDFRAAQLEWQGK